MLTPTLSILHTHKYLWLLLLPFLLIGCGGSTTKIKQPPIPSLSNLLQATDRADHLPSPQREQQYIEIARQLKGIGEIEQAVITIQKVDPEILPDSDYLTYVMTASQLFQSHQSVLPAYELLSSPRLAKLWTSLDNEQQKPLYRHRALVNSQLDNPVPSLEDFIALDRLLEDTLDITENHEHIWQELIKISLVDLQELSISAADNITQGWYQLAIAVQSSPGNSLEGRSQAVAQWVQSNPTHPASLELPMDLQLLQTLIEQRPRNIALLLPLKGKLAAAGKTIRNGFMAAYYSQGPNNNNDANQPAITLYDTSEAAINIVYDKAVSEGADLIIGPLAKDKVAQLKLREQLPVTTLALNYVNDKEIFVENSLPFYQFGLSLEDEAAQVADRAWLEGHRYAMIIASDADWSSRTADAFIKHWRQKGGTVAVSRQYSDQSSYSKTIESALSINESKSRAKRLKRLFGRNFEFEPRRRQDIDMIFLVARSSEGQQIKPTLAFHYAGDIPVYATSQIFSSTQSVSKNSDLNGIRFITLPWTLDPNNTEKKLIETHLTVHPSYERLHAMGADAYLLYDRVKQFSRIPNTVIYGSTGKLSLGKNQRVVRKQPWAEIVNGQAKPLPYLVDETNQQE